jgi:hypothetical protein
MSKPLENFIAVIEAFLTVQDTLRRKRKKLATQTSAGVVQDKKPPTKQKTFQVGILAKQSNICCY